MVAATSPENPLIEQHDATGAKLMQLDHIVTKGMQVRVGGTDPAKVKEYAEIYREKGARGLPAIVVFEDKQGAHFLAAGHHRVAAARKAELGKLPAVLKQGEKRDALFYAMGDNGNHGLALTADDKRHIVGLHLGDPEWVKMSDRAIAKHACVGATLVGQMRKTFAGADAVVRTGQDGRVIAKRGTSTKAQAKAKRLAEAPRQQSLLADPRGMSDGNDRQSSVAADIVKRAAELNMCDRLTSGRKAIIPRVESIIIGKDGTPFAAEGAHYVCVGSSSSGATGYLTADLVRAYTWHDFYTKYKGASLTKGGPDHETGYFAMQVVIKEGKGSVGEQYVLGGRPDEIQLVRVDISAANRQLAAAAAKDDDVNPKVIADYLVQHCAAEKKPISAAKALILVLVYPHSKGITRDELEKAAGFPLDVHPGQLRKIGLLDGGANDDDTYLPTKAGVALVEAAVERMDMINGINKAIDNRREPEELKPDAAAAVDVAPSKLPATLGERRLRWSQKDLADDLEKHQVYRGFDDELALLILMIGVPALPGHSYGDEARTTALRDLEDQVLSEISARLRAGDTAALPDFRSICQLWQLDPETYRIRAERAVPE